MQPTASDSSPHKKASEVRGPVPPETIIAAALKNLDERHYRREITMLSAYHRDGDEDIHYEGSEHPDCNPEKCLEDFTICNGCGTQTCMEADLRAILMISGEPKGPLLHSVGPT